MINDKRKPSERRIKTRKLNLNIEIHILKMIIAICSHHIVQLLNNNKIL